MLGQDAIRQKLMALDCRTEIFARLCGIPQSSISRWMRGLRGISNAQELHIANVVAELEDLSRVAEPFHLNFRKVEAIEKLLALHRTGDLKREVE